MINSKTPAERLQRAEYRIDWVLSHPHTSEWLKVSLQMARTCNPIETINDLELLTTLLQDRSRALVDDLLPPTTLSSSPCAADGTD